MPILLPQNIGLLAGGLSNSLFTVRAIQVLQPSKVGQAPNAAVQDQYAWGGSGPSNSYPSMAFPQDPGPMNIGSSSFAGMRPDVSGPGSDVPLPPRRPNDLTSFQAMAPAGAPQDINTPPADQPNSNVIGTAASGAPEITAQKSQGLGDYLGKAANLVGGIYGAGGPGDALIALGLSNRTNGASIQTLNAMTAQRAAVDNKAYKDLMIEQAKNKVSAQNSFANNSYKYLLGKGVPEPTATAAITAAQAGNSTPLNDLFKQFESRDEYKPLITPEERAAHGIRPTDTAPYRLNMTTNKLEGVGGGGTTINNVQNPIMATIGEQLKTTQTQATAAAAQLRAYQEAKAQLDAPGGIIAGFRAGDRLALQKMAALFGADPSKVRNTETFQAEMKPAVLEIVKGLGSGTGISNADLKFSQQAAGTDKELDEGTIRRILEIAERSAKYKIDQHNEFVDQISGASGEAQPYAQALKVKLPPAAKQPPANARLAPDGNYYIPDPNRPKQYLKWVP
jgi:hypothetical protein